jgi:transcriptional regulator with XRE-family HTH domain
MGRKPTFGEFLRAERLKAGLGLRAFAEAAGLQPSNLSNIEHGRIPPPQDRKTLDRLADVLGFEEGPDKRARLFDLAVKGKERPPADVAAFAAKTPGVPALLRTLENRRLGKEELERLTEYIRTLRKGTG